MFEGNSMNLRQRVLLSAVLYWCGITAFALQFPYPHTDYAVSVEVGPSSGSGFILGTSNSVYLATARHVVFNPKRNWELWGPIGHLRYFGRAANPQGLPPTGSLNINYSTLILLGEVRYSTNHDVCLIRLGDLVPTADLKGGKLNFLNAVTNASPGVIVPFHPLTRMKRLYDVEAGEEVYLFGFPKSIGLDESPQIDGSYPLLRRGIVAGFNNAKGTVILDCPAYQGDSGAPVLSKVHAGVDWEFSFIGIQTEFVPFREIWENKHF
jgi:hypothetical protein